MMRFILFKMELFADTLPFWVSSPTRNLLANTPYPAARIFPPGSN
jgi:hypothetical protein